MTWFPAGGCSGWGGNHRGPCACSVPAGPGRRALPPVSGSLPFRMSKILKEVPVRKTEIVTVSVRSFLYSAFLWGSRR